MTCSRSGDRSTITTPPSPELREFGPTAHARGLLERAPRPLRGSAARARRFRPLRGGRLGRGRLRVGPHARAPSRPGRPKTESRSWRRWRCSPAIAAAVSARPFEAVYAEPRGIWRRPSRRRRDRSNSAAIRFYGRLACCRSWPPTSVRSRPPVLLRPFKIDRGPARVAQLVEHFHGKEGVTSSSLVPGFLAARPTFAAEI